MERNWLEEAQKRWQENENQKRRGRYRAIGAGDFPPFSVVWGALDLSPHVYRITIDNSDLSIVLFDVSRHFRGSIWIMLKRAHYGNSNFVNTERLYLIDKAIEVHFSGITQHSEPKFEPFVLTLEGKLRNRLLIWEGW